MNFKAATDDLLGRIDHKRLAKELKASVASIRQARLRPDAAAHRSPPNDWRAVVSRLAREQAARFEHLADTLDGKRNS